MTSPISFHHVGLNCNDMVAQEAFYTRHFGFRRVQAFDLDGGEQIVYLKSGNVYLEMFRAGAERPGGPPDKDGPAHPGVRHLAFKVDDVNAQLEAMGDEAKVTLGPLGFDTFIPGWKTVWVADPEGNIVEISQGYVDQQSPP